MSGTDKPIVWSNVGYEISMRGDTWILGSGLIYPADWHPLVVGREWMKCIHNFRVGSIVVVISDHEVDVLLVLTLYSCALFEGLLYVFFLEMIKEND